MRVLNIEACPRCGNPVSVHPTSGGRGSNESTAYEAVCDARCGYRSTELPSNCSGRKADAIREHNQIAKTWPAAPAVRSKQEIPKMTQDAAPAPAIHPLRMASPGMHPTRMAMLANSLASKKGASEDVRILASIVRELCHQLDRASGDARIARVTARRGF